MTTQETDWSWETPPKPSIIVFEAEARATRLLGPDGELIWVRPKKEFPMGFHGSNR